MARIPINLKTGTVDSSQVVLGIDLGTTNSLIAYMVDGRPLALKGSSDQAVVPSVIHFKEDGSILVGKKAMEQLLLDSKNTIYSVKRLLGRSYKDIAANHSQLGYEIIDSDEMELVKIKVKDTYYSPIELSSFILRELKERAEIELNQTIQKVVITVPAYFNDSQRQATRDAGKLAGLDVLRIINEPTAASLAYGIGLDKSEQKTIAVYDLGGGTFDISILQIVDGVFEVLSTNGDTFLGGDDFDQAIVRYWMQQLGLSDQDVQNNKNLSQTLRLEAERAKVHLSSNDEFTSTINSQQITISATHFSQLIKHLIDRTIKKCAQAVVDSGLSKSEIDQVILVGGSTRVPPVKEQVTQFFATQINDQIDPDQAVALGAAIQADILAGNQKDLLLLDITPLSLGLETLGGLMDFIIPRNSKIPTVAKKQYSTSVDGQVNLKIAVYQGEREFVQDNRKLGEFILSGIPAMPAGIPKVEIKFIVDADGILKVSANELRSNTAQSIEIKPTYGLSDQDVEQMLADALQHASTDIEDRALRETINEAEQLVLQSKKFINQNKEDISAQEVELLQTRLKQLDDLLDSNDKDKIQIAMDTLNQTSRPMVERAMDQTISSALKNRSIND